MKFNQEMIVKSLQRKVSDEEEHLLDQWLNEDESNSTYYQQLKTIWENAGFEEDTKRFDAHKGWNNLQSALNHEIVTKHVSLWSYTWLKVAASVVFAILGVVLYTNISESTDDGVVQIITLESDTEQKIFELPDQSLVTLLPGTRISYSEGFINDRSIQLTGRAYFDVTNDLHHPFEVTTDGAIITVLGTEFMMGGNKNDINVVVSEGKVSVRSQITDTDRVLKEGEAVLVDRTNGDIKDIEDPDNLLSWKTGILQFDNDPLSKVVNDINHHYDVQLRFKNGALASCRLTSVFEDKSLDEVIEILQLVLNIEIRRSDQNEYLISGKGC